VRSMTNALAEQLQKVGTAAYQAAGAPSGDGGSGDGGPGASSEQPSEPASGSESDEAVEGEFKEV